MGDKVRTMFYSQVLCDTREWFSDSSETWRREMRAKEGNICSRKISRWQEGADEPVSRRAGPSVMVALTQLPCPRNSGPSAHSSQNQT